MTRWLVGSLSCALVTILAGRAHAQQPVPSVAWVSVRACEASHLDEETLLARLRVELTSDGVGEVRVLAMGAAPPANAGNGQTVAVVQLEAQPCEVDAATYLVRIDDLVTHKRVERLVDLSETVVGVRPRALALATVELLRASWAELVIVPPEEHPDAPPPLVRAMRARATAAEPATALASPNDAARATPAYVPPPSRATALSIGAALDVRTFADGHVSPFGGMLTLDLPISRALVLRILAEVALGTAYDPIGAVDLGLATGGVALLYSVGLGTDVLVSIGPHVAGGLAWTRGQPFAAGTAASSGLGGVVLVGGLADVDVRFAQRWSLRFTVFVDATPVGVQALVSGVPSSGIVGASIAATAGIAFSP